MNQHRKSILSALCLILLISISYKLQAQEYGKKLLWPIPFDSTTEKFALQEVVEVSDADADQLYGRAKSWMQKQFGVQQLDFDSQEDARLVHGYSFPVMLKGGMGIMISAFLVYRVTVETKAGRYRYRFTDFIVATNQDGSGDSGAYEGWYETNRNMKAGKKSHTKLVNQLATQTDEGLKKVIASLEKAMQGETKSDW